MATDQKTFDTQLSAAVQQVTGIVSDVATQTTNINTTVQAIIDKIAAGGASVDLSAEAAQLASMQTGLTGAQQALDGIAAQLPTTPTPSPSPTP